MSHWHSCALMVALPGPTHLRPTACAHSKYPPKVAYLVVWSTSSSPCDYRYYNCLDRRVVSGFDVSTTRYARSISRSCATPRICASKMRRRCGTNASRILLIAYLILARLYPTQRFVLFPAKAAIVAEGALTTERQYEFINSECIRYWCACRNAHSRFSNNYGLLEVLNGCLCVGTCRARRRDD